MTERESESSLVSVVVPAWNAAAFLSEAIRSILAQDAGPLEIIVVDDGSSDDTSRVAASFGAPVRVLMQDHAGIAAARNRGVSAARGPLLAFLDADDLWTPEKLRLQRRALDSSPSFDMVFGHAVEFSGTSPSGAPRPALLPGSALIRRASFDRVGRFREDLRVGEFVDWLARAREAGLRHAVLDAVCLRRRLHAANTGRILAGARQDYVKVVRDALQRRRAGGGS